MSDRKQALQALRDKVAAGTCDHGSFLQEWHENTAYSGGCGLNAHKAYDGSLDAAKALHDAVLPGLIWVTLIDGYGATIAVSGDEYSGQSPDPARAWLLAILSALIAKEDAP